MTDFEIDECEITPRWEKQSIFKIPSFLTAQNENAYKPQLVSIGPYHHESPDLKRMKEHKDRARNQFLKQSKQSQCNLLEMLKPEVQKLKDAYNELDHVRWTDDAFHEVMILDGCFILELLGAIINPTYIATGYSINDPVFSRHGQFNIVPLLKRDMLMLENEIPMIVLRKLDEVNQHKVHNLPDRILRFFFEKCKSTTKEMDNSLHILDMLRTSLIGPLNPTKTSKMNTTTEDSKDIIRSAKELHEAGIRIKRSNQGSHLMQIDFHNVLGGVFGAVLRLPLIKVDHLFETQYRNMVAFERFCVTKGNEVTSYIFFMDNIIDSEEDVKLLHKGCVIQNALGSNDAVAKMFNSLSTDITLDPNTILAKIHDQVGAYCRKPTHRWRAYFYHTYFTNPWVAITVMAAIFIFAITILSTVYTILSYIQPRKL